MSHPFEFTYHNPTRIVFGPDSFTKLNELVPHSARVLLLYGGRTLSIIQPALLRELIEYKRAKLEQLGREVFGLPNPSAEDTIAALETFYRSLGMPIHLRDADINEPDAAERVMAALSGHGKSALGGHAEIDEEKTFRILKRALNS